MKRGFKMNSNGGLTSALVSLDTADVLRIGDRIRVSRDLDLGYAALIEEGERGTIDYIDTSTGMAEVLMDRYHAGLVRWENHIWLQPYGTEDILSGIQITAITTLAA